MGQRRAYLNAYALWLNVGCHASQDEKDLLDEKENMHKIGQIGFLILLTTMSVFGQENFIPEKPDNISEAEYRRGELMLKNSWQQVVDDNFNIVANDYWNFAVSYQVMGQPKEKIYDYLWQAKATDRNKFCEIFNSINKGTSIDSMRFFKTLGEDFRQLVSDCSIITENAFDIEEYIKKSKYDRQLIYKLSDLLTEDQKWRNGKDEDLKKTIETDKANILKAEEVIKKYGYPGKKMVGQKFDFVIWIVIQHAELEYQERYLPLIAEAVENQELGKPCLRMLLDRIYTKKTGLQLFGSQIGVQFSDDKTIEAVKLKYNL